MICHMAVLILLTVTKVGSVSAWPRWRIIQSAHDGSLLVMPPTHQTYATCPLLPVGSSGQTVSLEIINDALGVLGLSESKLSSCAKSAMQILFGPLAKDAR